MRKINFNLTVNDVDYHFCFEKTCSTLIIVDFNSKKFLTVYKINSNYDKVKKLNQKLLAQYCSLFSISLECQNKEEIQL